VAVTSLGLANSITRPGSASGYEIMLTKLSQFQAQAKRFAYPDESLAVLSPRQGKCAGIGKVGTYPASQSKI
jgi:hypothetical protein